MTTPPKLPPTPQGPTGCWLRSAIGLLTILATLPPVFADWPQYRRDAGRSGYTPDRLPNQLTKAWEFRADHGPRPAWPRSDRLTFDHAIQPVISAGHVIFGDSVTGVVTAVDLNSGKTAWEFFTEGPVRFAPAVWRDRLFVTSDDGCLYALSLTNGQLLWKHRGGPDDSRRLGNERMISRWPARGSALVVDDRVYYGAGVWPSDGIFLYAIDPLTGNVQWANDRSGSLEMPQPHGGADAESGVAAQGYLAAADPLRSSAAETPSRPRLLVTTGRAVPAAFDRASGDFQYFNLQKYGHKGGANVVVSNGCFLNSGLIFDVESGESVGTLGSTVVVATPQGVIRGVSDKLEGTEWRTAEKLDRRGNPYSARTIEPMWSVEGVPQSLELIAADKTVVVGADNEVLTVDTDSRLITWRTPVDGRALGLAASDGCLIVSTDHGVLSCFNAAAVPADAANDPQDSARTSSNANNPRSATPPAAEAAAFPEADPIASAAAQILRESGITQGYCLDIGCGDGRLTEEIARRTSLHIVAVETDPELVSNATHRFYKRKLLGSRVTVLKVDDLSATGLPNYFANLVISQRSVLAGPQAASLKERERLLRPWGGVSMCGGTAGRLERIERGALQGAGQWTHQYSTPGNAACSGDELVRGPLGVLWFRDIELEMPQRHGRGPGPLFHEGRLYSMGLNELACVDAYNGTLLWKFPLPGILQPYNGDELMGTAGTHSNYCIADSGLYVRRGAHCLRIDRVSGKLLQQFDTPLTASGAPGVWGFIASQNGVLIGTLADPEHVVTYRYVDRGGDMQSLLTESRTLFAMDAVSGQVLWRYEAMASIRHNAIAFNGDVVYLIDRPVADFDRVKNAKADYHPTGSLLALDARSGKRRWQSVEEIDGTLLALSDEHPVLLMGSQPTRFALASETGRGLAAFDIETGKQRWRTTDSYSSRPMLNDQTIFAQGGAWDLLSGAKRHFDFSRSYGCGILAGSRHTMVFRSATLGYFDLDRQQKTENFGGIRPGCWINAIPAGGLVLVPDASAGCVCSYLNQSWFALEPDGLASPIISPAGGSYRDPVEVSLKFDSQAAAVRYTLDGTMPVHSSPEFPTSLRIESSALLRLRAFDHNGRPGRMSESMFVVDPALLPIENEHWTTWDVTGEPTSSAPSRWEVRDGVIHQRSNIFRGSASETDPAVERCGTLRILNTKTPVADGTFELDLRCDDDDSVGVVFRCQDERHHYLFSSDSQRGFSLLAVKNGDQYKVLTISDRSYLPGKWHQLQVRMHGSSLQVLMDHVPLLTAEDSTFTSGTVGLYCWGADKVQFRQLKTIAHNQP
ncbi:MAG: PQQ-binding-like beta-propeller repeat protein [Planctomycetaceae bacterium]